MTQPILTHEFMGKELYFVSTPHAPAIIKEILSDNYEIIKKGIDIRSLDVIVDCGANEGMFSVMMSILFPWARVISFEPVPRTYATLIQNIELNGCANIEAYNIGLGKPGRVTAIMNVHKEFSGGSSMVDTFDADHHDQVEVGLISLNDIFHLYSIERCRLLKMDIEGAEYDVLYNTSMLPLCDYMVAEFHINRRLEFEARRIDALATWCSNQTDLIHVDPCRMAD